MSNGKNLSTPSPSCATVTPRQSASRPMNLWARGAQKSPQDFSCFEPWSCRHRFVPGQDSLTSYPAPAYNSPVPAQPTALTSKTGAAWTNPRSRRRFGHGVSLRSQTQRSRFPVVVLTPARPAPDRPRRATAELTWTRLRPLGGRARTELHAGVPPRTTQPSPAARSFRWPR